MLRDAAKSTVKKDTFFLLHVNFTLNHYIVSAVQNFLDLKYEIKMS